VPEQFEPGLPDEEQAYEHVLDMVAGRVEIAGDYKFNSWLGVFGVVPVGVTTVEAGFKDIDGQLFEDFSSIHHRTETVIGVADIHLGVNLYPLPQDLWKNTDLEVGLGATLPTGSVEPDPFVKGAQGLTHQHMFYGTGTVNPLIRVILKQQLGKGMAVAWGQGIFSLYRGKHDYRGSSVVAGGIGGSYPVLIDRLSVSLQHEVFYESAARWGDNVARNSGRTDLILTAGLMWSEATWSAQLSAKHPYRITTSGDQLEAPVLLSLDLFYKFPL